ncbi:MAG: hypothetical protein AB7G44_01410 [Bacteroidia bacterium]
MKKFLLPISIVAVAVFAVACNGNKADTSTNNSLQIDTPLVNHIDSNPANDKVQLNSDNAVVNTNKEQGETTKMGETNTKGSAEKGTIENPSTGKTEVVKHASDNQAKLDSIKKAKQKQRGN